MPVLTRIVAMLFRTLPISRPRCPVIVEQWVVEPSGETYQSLTVPTLDGMTTRISGAVLRCPEVLA